MLHLALGCLQLCMGGWEVNWSVSDDGSEWRIWQLLVALLESPQPHHCILPPPRWWMQWHILSMADWLLTPLWCTQAWSWKPEDIIICRWCLIFHMINESGQPQSCLLLAVLPSLYSDEWHILWCPQQERLEEARWQGWNVWTGALPWCLLGVREHPPWSCSTQAYSSGPLQSLSMRLLEQYSFGTFLIVWLLAKYPEYEVLCSHQLCKLSSRIICFDLLKLIYLATLSMVWSILHSLD